MRLLALLLLAALGCSEDERYFLPPLLLGSDAGQSGTALPIPESVEGWSLAPASERLRCGEPCASVTSLGSCEDEIAVRCEGGVVVCEECSADGRACVADGIAPSRCARACDGDPIPGAPDTNRICCPNTKWCDRGAQALCDATGTDMVSQPCVHGLDCVEGQCRPARPYVHVLFDTSGSMGWLPSGAEPDPKVYPATATWPACDDTAHPRERLGISKVAFHDLFGSATYEHVLFSLQRFPQRLDLKYAPLCPAGTYAPFDAITGHHVPAYLVPDDASGAWFTKNLPEVLLVPFPTRAAGSNRAALQSWLDFAEEYVSSETPCASHGQCPGGLCTDPVSGGTCRYFKNPEVRPTGATPLGLSLFYAGEYIRKHVVVDGIQCKLDADCLSAGYVCKASQCVDPNRHCRQRSIVAFTDGQDTSSPDGWYQPVVQAKRLGMGLDCETDADCEGATCQLDGVCLPSTDPCSRFGRSCPLDLSTFPGAYAQGASRLRDRNGDIIRVVVHVIDASGFGGGEGAAMAGYGGGLLVPADLASSATLLDGIKGVVDWKDVDFCQD